MAKHLNRIGPRALTCVMNGWCAVTNARSGPLALAYQTGAQAAGEHHLHGPHSTRSAAIT